MKFNQKSIGKWLGAMVVAGATSAAMAVPVTVSNPGFESGGTGWDISGSGAGIEESVGANTIGTRSFRYFGSDTASGRVSQSFTFQAGHDYSLSFLLRRSTDTIVVGGADDGLPDAPGATPALTVKLGLAGIPLTTFDYDDPEVAGEFWWDYVANLGTSNGGVFELAFEFTGFNDAYLDEISLTDDGCAPRSTHPGCVTGGGGNNGVPEPGSLLLVGAALAGLGLVRRRKAV